MKKKYKTASLLLKNIWINIDWQKINEKRKIKIWQEFENKARALSKCYSRLEPFLDKICRSFNSYISDKKIKHILKKDHDEILDIYRQEIQIPMLLIRLELDKKNRV